MVRSVSISVRQLRFPARFRGREALLTAFRYHILVCRRLRGQQRRNQCVHLRTSLSRYSISYTYTIAVANEQGSFTTPSFVSFTAEERLIGEAAKNQAAMNPANTIFDIK